MFCKNCGAEIAEGSSFCAKCGTNVNDADVVVKRDDEEANAQLFELVEGLARSTGRIEDLTNEIQQCKDRIYDLQHDSFKEEDREMYGKLLIAGAVIQVIIVIILLKIHNDQAEKLFQILVPFLAWAFVLDGAVEIPSLVELVMFLTAIFLDCAHRLLLPYLLLINPRIRKKRTRMIEEIRLSIRKKEDERNALLDKIEDTITIVPPKCRCSNALAYLYGLYDMDDSWVRTLDEAIMYYNTSGKYLTTTTTVQDLLDARARQKGNATKKNTNKLKK